MASRTSIFSVNTSSQEEALHTFYRISCWANQLIRTHILCNVQDVTGPDPSYLVLSLAILIPLYCPPLFVSLHLCDHPLKKKKISVMPCVFRCTEGPEEGVGSLGAEFTGACEPPSMDSRNKAHILLKRSRVRILLASI